MKDGREYVDYLQDILDAIAKAEQFIEGMDFSSFSAGGQDSIRCNQGP